MHIPSLFYLFVCGSIERLKVELRFTVLSMGKYPTIPMLPVKDHFHFLKPDIKNSSKYSFTILWNYNLVALYSSRKPLYLCFYLSLCENVEWNNALSRRLSWAIVNNRWQKVHSSRCLLFTVLSVNTASTE